MALGDRKNGGACVRMGWVDTVECGASPELPMGRGRNGKVERADVG